MRSDDLDFRGYVEGTGSRQPPTAGEERRLIARAQAGDTAARDELVERNMRLVIKIAGRWARFPANPPLSDLSQAGSIGLMRAIEKFEPGRGLKLSTYATHWIMQAIQREADHGADGIRMKPDVATKYRKVRKAADRLYELMQCEPSIEDIAAVVDLTFEQVERALNSKPRFVSLDAIVGDDDEDTSPLADLIPDPNADTYEEARIPLELERAIERMRLDLTDGEVDAIVLRYGLGGATEHTLEEAGALMGVTRERVRQLQTRGIAKLGYIAGAAA